jgi:hypothetical protein
MEKLSQEYILSIAFKNSMEKEAVLLRKYDEYLPELKDNSTLLEMVKEFKENSEEHMKILKDKMIKLNIQG